MFAAVLTVASDVNDDDAVADAVDAKINSVFVPVKKDMSYS